MSLDDMDEFTGDVSELLDSLPPERKVDLIVGQPDQRRWLLFADVELQGIRNAVKVYLRAAAFVGAEAPSTIRALYDRLNAELDAEWERRTNTSAHDDPCECIRHGENARIGCPFFKSNRCTRR